MESRLYDLLYVLALTVLFGSGVSLILYALWQIAWDVMRAIHQYLTCREFDRSDEAGRAFYTKDRVMRGMLTMHEEFRRVFFPLGRFGADLARLRDYRFEKVMQQNDQLIWDRRLGALLTPDEHAFLYRNGEKD